MAQGIKFPTPSYEGEELAKVREWEKTWVGKKVTTADVDQVKELLPDAVYQIMKNPKDFGAEGDMWFEVVPYREYKVSPGLIESTQKYAPQAKLDENLDLMNYGKIAGIPFPQPDTSDPVKAGTQAAWNFDAYTHGDCNRINNKPANIVDCRTRMERSAGQLRWMMFWSEEVMLHPGLNFQKISGMCIEPSSSGIPPLLTLPTPLFSRSSIRIQPGIVISGFIPPCFAASAGTPPNREVT